MHKEPYVVLIFPVKPTLTSKVSLDYPQNVLIRFQNIFPGDGGVDFSIDKV
jgi:hypothetical protein